MRKKKVSRVTRKFDPPWDPEIDPFLSMVTFNEKNIPHEKIIAYGRDLLRMAMHDEDMKTVRPWLLKHNIYSSHVSQWKIRVPEFAVIYMQALELLGYKVIDLALDNKIHAGMAKFILPLYSAEVRSTLRFLEHLKFKSNQAPLTVIEEDDWLKDQKDNNNKRVLLPKWD